MGLTRFIFSGNMPGMKTPSEIIDFAGPDRVMAAVKVAPDRIRLARTADKLPASWYDALERLCGRPLDRSLFTFKGREQ